MKMTMRRITCLLVMTIAVGCAKAADVDVSQLKVPAGFKISIFSNTGYKPRLMAFSPGGVLLATAQADGVVFAMPDPNKTGKAERVVKVLEDLNVPHGIAFHNGKLYVAETDKIVRYDWDEAGLKATNPQPIAKLEGGGGHHTRTILFANGKLYASVGSSCNVCTETGNRAVIMEFNEDGSGGHVFARGTRNAVGIALSPQTGTVWGGENGRDWLGDDLPPEEINDYGQGGGDFGWPHCYANKVTDVKNPPKDPDYCKHTVAPKYMMQAHSAPLGIAFYTGNMFPAEYKNDLFVAFHGSWNRSVPTGYKVVRIRLNKQGVPQGMEDFLTGFIRPGEKEKGKWMGRPVGITVGPDGAMYVSDDASGPIYRITYGK